eukprot:5227561-Amphidinium_carterae.2
MATLSTKIEGRTTSEGPAGSSPLGAPADTLEHLKFTESLGLRSHTMSGDKWGVHFIPELCASSGNQV